MKISWGHKILFAYLAFVAGIMFLVFKASQEDYDLVTANYYEAELKYQDIIDQKENTARLSAPLIIGSLIILSGATPLIVDVRQTGSGPTEPVNRWLPGFRMFGWMAG